MPVIFSKNCILEGLLDYYCLACSVHLTSEDYVFSHIYSQKHKDQLSSIGYIQKYEGDHIRKAHGVYFCELCNTVMATVAKVEIHICDQFHLTLKKKRLLKRLDNCIAFNEKISITDNAWHSIVDSACLLCSVEFENVVEHKRQKTHVLNLINSELIIDVNSTFIHRKIEDLNQCLSCNKVLSEQTLVEHYKLHERKSFPDKGDDMRNIERDIQCLGFDKNSLKQKETSEDMLTEVPLTSMPSDVRTLAKQRGLSIMEQKAVCNPCNEQVFASLHHIEEHVSTTKHIENEKIFSECKKEKAKNLQKVMINEYTQLLQYFKFETKNHLIINKTICIDFDSYMGFNPHYEKIIFCRFCNTEFPITKDNVETHFLTPQHSDFMAKCYVMSSLEGEFVRQLKSDLYDCGYCAHVETDFDDMLEHLATADHKKRRSQFEALLKHKEKRMEMKAILETFLGLIRR